MQDKLDKLIQACRLVRTSVVIDRLFVEDPGVKGVCWFAKYREDRWHVFANSLRVTVAIILAPLYITIPTLIKGPINDWLKTSWGVELASTPEAVLYNSPSGGPGRYEVTGRRPRWLLKADFKYGQLPTFTQVEWSENIRDRGYTAISYPMESAYQLFLEAALTLQDPSPTPNGRRWSRRDRQAISMELLLEYGRAKEREGEREGVEYIWLDEFCLSHAGGDEEPLIDSQRSREVGQLADIFKGAARVAVFCHVIGCDHTTLECPWGTRIFTIGEILHATDVIRLTRIIDSGQFPLTEFHYETGRSFRGSIQAHAAENQRWHLYAIMQHASNAGAVSWQSAIHSLVVEVIRRDEASGFTSHRYLGKVLNGLLPRRARLDDLKGDDGWGDLAWLLELNQGFYNAASLAAVCNTAHEGVAKHRWLGKPILPDAGNERLEPVVIAFPVRSELPDGEVESTLCVISPRTTLLRHTLIRDASGLYNSEDMLSLKVFLGALLVIFIVIGLLLLAVNIKAALSIIYITCVLYVLVELLVGTIYVVKDGWVYLEDNEWGSNPQPRLQRCDPEYTELVPWGNRQLTPTWETLHSPSSPTRVASLVDLKGMVTVRVAVTEKPNCMISMAVHGSGITCLLLDRDDDEPAKVANKVGMTNVPPYILSQGRKSGTVCIGGTYDPNRSSSKKTKKARGEDRTGEKNKAKEQVRTRKAVNMVW